MAKQVNEQKPAIIKPRVQLPDQVSAAAKAMLHKGTNEEALAMLGPDWLEFTTAPIGSESWMTLQTAAMKKLSDIGSERVMVLRHMMIRPINKDEVVNGQVQHDEYINMVFDFGEDGVYQTYSRTVRNAVGVMMIGFAKKWPEWGVRVKVSRQSTGKESMAIFMQVLGSEPEPFKIPD